MGVQWRVLWGGGAEQPDCIDGSIDKQVGRVDQWPGLAWPGLVSGTWLRGGIIDVLRGFARMKEDNTYGEADRKALLETTHGREVHSILIWSTRADGDLITGFILLNQKNGFTSNVSL